MPVIACMLMLVLAAILPAVMAGYRRTRAPSRTIFTVSGTVKSMAPARNRPGCVLELTNGTETGLYYVPLSPHDARRAYPEGQKATFRMHGSAKAVDGVFDTFGPAHRDWDVTGHVWSDRLGRYASKSE